MGSCSLAGVDEGRVLDANKQRNKIGKMKGVVGVVINLWGAGNEMFGWDEVQYCNWCNNYQLWKLRVNNNNNNLSL